MSQVSQKRTQCSHKVLDTALAQTAAITLDECNNVVGDQCFKLDGSLSEALPQE
jgi:hypothetical protein